MRSPTRSPQHARLATMLLFFVCGAAYATWGIHIPTIQQRFALSEAWLSVAMFAVAGGAILAMPKVGRWVGRAGSHYASHYSGLFLGAALALILLIPTFAALLPLLLLFGAGNAALDVAMNAQAITVEKHLGRPIMSSLHGMFSLGGMVGATLGGLLLAAGITPLQHCLGMGGLTALSTLLGSRLLLPDHHPDEDRTATHLQHPRSNRLIWALGGLAFLGLIAEGGMYDWSVIYLRDAAQASSAQSSAAYAAFSGGMALGRFGGDRLRARYGSIALLRYSAMLAFAGMALALLWPSTAIVGFALAGLGAANLIPVLFSASAHIPDTAPAEGIAGVARLAYIGLLLGPVMIGALAHATGLRIGLGLIALCTALIGLLAHKVLRGITAAGSAGDPD